ncbi:MAG: transketolase family protein [Defluviitaleaceae bacterium]|nr:transketolase family protein [Defluviitaleaceae bacterium]
MPKTIREAYGEALVKYGKNDNRIVVLDADLAGSTKSSIFAKAYPERFFNVGIAEANMVAMAAGMATEGKIPFVNTFAVFLTTMGVLGARTLAGYGGAPVKFMGAYGGMSDAYDGATHHAIEDIAIMRALPEFEVLVASDATITDWMVRAAIDSGKPMYIRLSRGSMPDLYKPDEKFEVGKGKIIHEGAKNDVTIIACGIMSGFSVEAAQRLEQEGLSVRVVDMYSIKPIDGELIAKCASDTKLIITAEEHNIYGGLGSAVAEVLAKLPNAAPMDMVGINDCYTQTGSYDALLHHYGVDTDGIVKKVKECYAKLSS